MARLLDEPAEQVQSAIKKTGETIDLAAIKGEAAAKKAGIRLKTVDVPKSQAALLIIAFVFLFIFVWGFIFNDVRAMLVSIFFCIVMQGMRGRGE